MALPGDGTEVVKGAGTTTLQRARLAVLLEEKYRALTTKYQRLVARFDALQQERLGTQQLALAALRAGPVAVALVGTDSVLFANEPWNALSFGPHDVRGFRTAPSVGAPRTFANLPALAVAEARRLVPAPDSAAVTGDYERLDGTMILEIRFEAQPGTGGASALVMATDVTSQRRMALELVATRRALLRRERMRAVGELAGGVAHDLRNLFVIMRQQLQQLEPEAPVRGILAGLLDDCDTLSLGLGDARREGGAAELDLGALVLQVAGYLKPGLERPERGPAIHLETRVPAGPVRVRGQATDLRQVLVNLVVNARDAMAKGGVLRLAVAGDDEGVVFTVEDEGTGIAPEHLPHLFEPFFTTKGRRGSGLGLATAKELVERHGGSLTLANRPESGAIARVRLPPAR